MGLACSPGKAYECLSLGLVGPKQIFSDRDVEEFKQRFSEIDFTSLV